MSSYQSLFPNQPALLLNSSPVRTHYLVTVSHNGLVLSCVLLVEEWTGWVSHSSLGYPRMPLWLHRVRFYKGNHPQSICWIQRGLLVSMPSPSPICRHPGKSHSSTQLELGRSSEDAEELWEICDLALWDPQKPHSFHMWLAIFFLFYMEPLRTAKSM